jgi:hypothetical protein
MGEVNSLDRGTHDRGLHDPLGAVERTLTAQPIFSLLDDGIPTALEDALRSELALSRAFDDGDVIRISALAARLVAIFDFLVDAQVAAERDEADGALLISSVLAAFNTSRADGKIKESELGDAVQTLSVPPTQPGRAWAPRDFPKGMTVEARAAYPKRPRHVGEIPPFSPKKVAEWRKLAARDLPQLSLIPDAVEKKSTADLKVLDAALDKVFHHIDAMPIDPKVITSGGKPTIDRARRNLALVSLDSIARETHVKLASDATPLIEGVEFILFHAAGFTFLLDREGRPTTLGLLPYAIIVAPAGSDIIRNAPPPGVYISIQRTGFNSFRLNGTAVSKVLFGGVGGFLERTLYLRTEHEIHHLLQYWMLERSLRPYIAGVVSESAIAPRSLTRARLEEVLPELIVRSVPFAVTAVIREANNIEFAKLAKDMATELFREFLFDEVKKEVELFLVKKIGTKILPLVNLVVSLRELADEDERIRVRHAIACMIVAIRGSSADEMTLSANVLGEIMADQFGDAVKSAVMARAKRHLGGLVHGTAQGDAAHSPAGEESTVPPDHHKPGEAAPAGDSTAKPPPAARSQVVATAAPAQTPVSSTKPASTPVGAENPKSVTPASLTGRGRAPTGDEASGGAEPTAGDTGARSAAPPVAGKSAGQAQPPAAAKSEPSQQVRQQPRTHTKDEFGNPSTQADARMTDSKTLDRQAGQPEPIHTRPPGGAAARQGGQQVRSELDDSQAKTDTGTVRPGEDQIGDSERRTGARTGPGAASTPPRKSLDEHEVELAEELGDQAEMFESHLPPAKKKDARFPNLEAEKTVAFSDETGFPIFSGQGRTGTESTDFPHVQSRGGDPSTAGHARVGVSRYEELSGQPPRRHIYDDPDVPGSFYAHHAEVKDRIHQIDNKQNGMTAVSKEMCSDCREWHRKVARTQQQGLTVADPLYVRTFNSDGSVDVYYNTHHPSESLRGQHAMRVPPEKPPTRGKYEAGSAW